MLLDGAYPLFQPLNSFLYLAVGELNKRAGFPELIIHMLTIIGVPPIEVHLEAFRHKLKFMPESFSKDARVAFRISDIRPKRFRRNISVTLDLGDVCPKGPGKICSKRVSSSADNLLNLCKRLLIHRPPFEQANIMASAAVSQTRLPPVDFPAWFGLTDFNVLFLEKLSGAPKVQFAENKGYRWCLQR